MRTIFILLMTLSCLSWASVAKACEFCTITYLGKKDHRPGEKKETKLKAKIFYEEQDWNEIPAAEAHQLHHLGHHAHDKQDEQIIHTILTAHLSDRLSAEADIPYVTRRSIEIDSHDRLGNNEVSQGLGDMTLIADYTLFEEEGRAFGILAGVKTPTGGTKELNSGGGRFEPELQPGTGSLDYIAGFTGSLHPKAMDFSANAVYVHKTEGAQDFRFGDVLSVSFSAEKKFDLNAKVPFKAGVTFSNQLEKKQNDDSGDIKDSGGYTLFIGPHVGLGYDAASIEFSYLKPVVQNLGGAHQELNGIWTGALSLKF